MFNLEDDPLEKNNIVDLFPEIVESIEKYLIKFKNANQIIESEEDGKLILVVLNNGKKNQIIWKITGIFLLMI